jgi:16S rRNA (adenine1518-N6/adenine1519-N6)-dimethyltransferase
VKAQTRSEIASLLDKYGLSPVHRLGQHFLADGNITRKIVAAAEIEPGDKVVEVGAGTGTLTVALANAGASVVAYEIDARLSPVLDETTRGLDVECRFEDITKVNLETALVGGGWKMVANLPYNVGTPLVLDSIRHQPHIQSFVVMVQREVAERFAATPGGKDYGIPSVVAQIYTEPVVQFRVPTQVFLPPPRVESAVITMPRVPAPEFAEDAIELASIAFKQRRKMIRGSLSGVLADPEAQLARAGLDPTVRAEDLSPHQYLELARSLR